MADELSAILEANRRRREEEQQQAAPADLRTTQQPQAAPVPQDPNAQQDAPEGFLEGAADIGGGIVAGGIRGLAQGLGGLFDFAGDIGAAGGDAATDLIMQNEPLARGIAEGYNNWTNSRLGRAFYQYTPFEADGSTTFARDLTGGGDEGYFASLGNDTANNITSEVVAVATAYGGGARRLAQSGNAAAVRITSALQSRNVFVRIGSQNAAIGVAAGVVLDPEEERLANLVQDFGIENDFIDWLAQDDDDGAIEGRIKNAIEETTVGFIADGVFMSLRAARAAMRGDNAGAEAAEAAARESVDNAAREVIGDVPPVAEPPRVSADGTAEEAAAQRLGDVANRADEILEARASANADSAASPGMRTEQAPSTSTAEGLQEQAERQARTRADGVSPAITTEPSGIAAAANRALEAAGLPGSLSPDSLRLTSTGRVIVPGSVKTALDEAGLGAPFASAAGALREGEVIFKAATPNGARIVGSMGREDLARFAADVKVRQAGPDAADVPASGATGQYRLGQLGSAERVPYILRGIIDQLPEDVRVRRSDADLQTAARAAADEIGEDPTAILEAARIVAGRTGDMDLAVKTLQTVWARAGREVDELLDIDFLSADQETVREALSRVHNLMTVGSYFTQAKSALGRGLRSLRLPDADTYVSRFGLQDQADELRRSGEMRPLPASRQELADWVELWRLTDRDPVSRARFLEGLNTLPGVGKYVRSSMANMFTANVLSGIPSILLNVVGPGLASGIRTIEKVSGGYLRAFLDPTLDASTRRAALASANDAAYAYTRTFGDIAQAFRFGKEAAMRGRPILGGGGSVTDVNQQFGPITRAARDAARRDGQNLSLFGSNTAADTGYALGNLVNAWPSVFARLNNGLDEFAKRLAYNGETRVRLMEDARAAGLQGDDFLDFVREGLERSTDDVGAARDADLLRAAERSTLTGTPGTEGSVVRRLAGTINSMRAEFPETRYVLPIFNVPANALGETLRRVPVVNTLFREAREELLGQRGVVAQNEAYGRMLFGASFLMGGFFMARNGMLTGAGPRDPRDRALWMETHRPYSIRIGDQWIDYSRYDIVGSLLGIPATVFDASVHYRNDKGMQDLVYASISASAEYFRDRAAMQTVSDLFNLGSQFGTGEVTFERLLGGTASRMVVPNFATQLGRNLTDDTVNVRATTWDRFVDTFPGLSLQLDPMRNVLGEPIHRPQDTLLENLVPVTMHPVTEWRDDAILDELTRLYENTGYSAGVRQQHDISGGYFDAREVNVEDGRSLFDHVMARRATTRVDGQTLRQALQELFDSTEYNEGVDAGAQVRNSSTGQTSRGYMVRQVFTSFNQAIERELANESEEAARLFAVVDAKRRDNGVLADYNATELADNPELFAALGIDFDAYVARVKGQDE